jgi:hypothetical protein
MIKTDYFKTRKDGVRLFRTYSDQHLYIIKEQTNELCEEAVDVENAPYTYIESDKHIEEVPADVLHQ